MAPRYPAKQISEALTDFVLSQCEKYWGQLQKLSSDELNSFVLDCMSDDKDGYEIPLPGTGEDFKDAEVGKIIALRYLVDEFLKAQSSLMGNNRPSMIGGIRKRRERGETVGRYRTLDPSEIQ